MQGPAGPVGHGPPGPPKINPGSSQEPRTPWQNIGQAKLKRLANSHQNPLGFDLVRGCFTFLPASGRPPAGRKPAEPWSLAPGTSSIRTNTKKRSLNDIPNGPILKGFVTILLQTFSLMHILEEIINLEKILSKFEGFRACASLRDNYRKLSIWVSSVLSGKVVLFGQSNVAKVATFGWPKASLRLARGRGAAAAAAAAADFREFS